MAKYEVVWYFTASKPISKPEEQNKMIVEETSPLAALIEVNDRVSLMNAVHIFINKIGE